jgi:hypothetical protein
MANEYEVIERDFICEDCGRHVCAVGPNVLAMFIDICAACQIRAMFGLGQEETVH